jgi:hypothetical protein
VTYTWAVVELVFMMLILKLPILYLAGVCYWAIRSEPKPFEGARAPARLEPGPDRPSSPGPRRPRRRGGPDRRDVRTARATSSRPSA